MGFDLPSWLTPTKWVGPLVHPIVPIVPIVPILPIPLPPIVPVPPILRRHWFDPRWWLLGAGAAAAVVAGVLHALPFVVGAGVGATAGAAAVAAIAAGAEALEHAHHDPKPADPHSCPPSSDLPPIAVKATFPLERDAASYSITYDPKTGTVTVKAPDGVHTAQLSDEDRAKLEKLYADLQSGQHGPTWDDTILASLTAGGDTYANSPAVRAIFDLLLRSTGLEDPRVGSPAASGQVPAPAHSLGMLRKLNVE